MKRSHINFVPRELRWHPVYNPRNAAAAAVLLVVMVYAIAFTNVHQNLELKQQAARSIASLNNDLKEKVAQVSGVPEVHVESKDEVVKRLLAEKTYWADVFKELSMVTPKDVWLTEFNTSLVDGKRVMVINGQSSSNALSTAFFSALEKSFYFRDISIQSMERLDHYSPALYRFRFACNTPDPKQPDAKQEKK